MTAKQALAVAALAGALVVAGVAVLTGYGWALITAGLWLAMTALLLYDPQKVAAPARNLTERLRAVGS